MLTKELHVKDISFIQITFACSNIIVVSSLPFSLQNKEGCDDITFLVEPITSLHVHVLN